MLTQSKLDAMLEMIMGGRAAEEIIYHHFTSGASNDLSRATEYAHRMVCNWGMSEKIGPFHLGDQRGDVFLGRDMLRKNNMSEETAKIVDQEVDKIVNSAYKSALEKLKKHIQILHDLAKKLLKEETIEGKEVLDLVQRSKTA